MSFRSIFLAATLAAPVVAQPVATPTPSGPHPLYRVTIVQRTTPAINYTHRAEPTKIDFKGTPLMPEAHGEATVENRRGATMIDARFDHVPPPTRYGSQYLTYVVWAISPNGRAQSVGELILNGSDKGRLQASTPFQAFALIVTAEPYYSVSQPSDVVVMENAIRPDTVGEVQTVDATYELLPRKEYTYDITKAATAPPSGQGVSMSEYEALVATYEAKNAIQIAESAGADKYAPERLHRARIMYDQARQLPRKTLGEQVVSQMREVAQIAEDAREISMKRSAEDRSAQLQAQQAAVEKQTLEARAAQEAAAEQARMDAERAQQQAAQAQADAQAQAQAQAAAQVQAAAQARQQQMTQTADRFVAPPSDNTRQTRARLRQQLTASGLQTLDTPRGLVVIVPDSQLEQNAAWLRGRLGVVATAFASYPNLRIEVDGNSEGSSESVNYRVSEGLAAHVSDMLTGQGVPPGAIATRAFGSTRPMAPNQTPAGREQNRRVEVVITGAAIGSMPVWDRGYPLTR